MSSSSSTTSSSPLPPIPPSLLSLIKTPILPSPLPHPPHTSLQTLTTICSHLNLNPRITMNVLTTYLLLLSTPQAIKPASKTFTNDYELLACITITCKNHPPLPPTCRDVINLCVASKAIRSEIDVIGRVKSDLIEGVQVPDIQDEGFWRVKDGILSAELTVLLKTGGLGVDLLPLLDSIYYSTLDTATDDPSMLNFYRDNLFIALGSCWNSLHKLEAGEICQRALGLKQGRESEATPKHAFDEK